jgi:hypothetical protein
VSDERDPLMDAIRAAGDVPPPPNRDRALARAMQAVDQQGRHRLSKGMIALLAAALLTVPATVFAERAAHPAKQRAVPTPVESVDRGSARESEDARPSPEASESTRNEPSGEDGGTQVSGGDDGTTSGSHEGSTISSGDGGSDDRASPSPTPSETSGSDGGSSGSSDGGSSSGTSGSD